jgi:hypothetical protein
LPNWLDSSGRTPQPAAVSGRGSLVGTSRQGPAANQSATLSNAIASDLQAGEGACRDAADVLSQYASAIEQAQQVLTAAQSRRASRLFLDQPILDETRRIVELRSVTYATRCQISLAGDDIVNVSVEPRRSAPWPAAAT